MEITKPMTLEGEEPLSKAINELMDTGTAVIVTKDQKYYGIIDDRNLRYGIQDPGKTKCETCAVKPPTLRSSASVLEQINAFMSGRFKALPVVEEDGKPLGITTRVDVLKEMMRERLIPKVRVSELMNKPVYTIEESAQIGKAKGVMKENDCHRLVVTKNGNPVGIISTLDLASFMTKPREMMRKPYVVKEIDTIMTRHIADVMRYDITTIPEESTIEDAAKRMIEKGVSSVLVISEKKPVGVLTAVDIFKKIQEIAQEEISLSVSGLSEENIWKFPEIKNKIGGVLEKFSGSFNIRNASVHIKEKKTVFEVFVYFDTDDGHISLSSERKDLKEAVDQLAAELHSVLARTKEKRRAKVRKVHTGREEEVS
jgi:CBS domain-containing protein/ribosome-associated translation inhibitor RaiA